MNATLRQVIIGQLRRALGELEKPNDDEEVIIHIGQHDLAFSPEDLNQEVDPEDYE